MIFLPKGYVVEKQMRSAAALRIIGDDLVPDEITRVLGCAPTSAETKGQVLRGKSAGRERVARSGSWRLEVADRTPDDLNGQIMEIVGRLNQDPEVWASLANRFRVDVFCGLFMAKSDEGFSLSPEALSVLGARRIELAVCLYAASDSTPPPSSVPSADRG
jgi:hypothetical protein